MGASKSCDGSQKPRGGQQRAEGGEVKASRMRHALPEEVIHLHTDYANQKTRVDLLIESINEQNKSCYTRVVDRNQNSESASKTRSILISSSS